MSSRALVYGARDETYWSGTPYYFSAELRRFGRERRDLVVDDLPPSRGREVVFPFLAWAARMRCKRTALFLLSQQFHDASVPSFDRQGTAGLVSFSQVLPDAVLRHKRATPDFKLVQYVDVTLTQLLADFDYAQEAPERVRDSLLEAERRAYEASDHVVVFHGGTRDVLQATSGLHPDRVRVLGRGVNLPPEAMAPAGPAAARQQGPVQRLMVVGRGPRRKGVFRLIEAMDALEDRERERIELHLAGPSPHELPRRAYLRSMGFVDATRREALVETMRSMSLGVLLSDADAHPGSVWEFLFLGVPVWVSNLPFLEAELRGFPALVQPFPLLQADLTQRLRSLLHDPSLLAGLSASASRLPSDLSWSRQAGLIGRYLLGTGVLPAVLDEQRYNHDKLSIVRSEDFNG